MVIIGVNMFLKLFNITLFFIFLPDQVTKINHIAFENNLHTFGFNFKLGHPFVNASVLSLEM